MTRAAALLLMAITVATGCGAGSGTAPPGWLTIAIANAPTNLDPGIGLDEASQRVHQLVFSALLKIGADLRIVPDLAERFETTDHQTYIAQIPAGVRFHDGRVMTADDVAFTFRRFLDPDFMSGKKGAFRDLERVDVLDARTVAFRLKAPSAAFPSSVANIGIVPDNTGSSMARSPIGSGPYRVVEFVPDDRIALEAFADYYRGAPANAGVLLKVVPDETMRGLELRNGSVDLVINDISPDMAHSLAADPSLVTITAPGTDFAYVGLNLRDGHLSDRRARQALASAINRDDITRHLRRDQARNAAGIIPSMSWAYADDLVEFGYDPAKARRLLDEAGLRDPDGDGPEPRLHLTLKTSTAEAYRLQAAIIQQHLAQVGVALDIRSYEFATLFADVVSGNVQLYTLVFTGGSVADPDVLRRVFHSTQTPPSGFNRGHYANPDVDALLDEATRATEESERRRLYIAAQRIIAEDVPLISLWARTNVAIGRRGLQGVTLSPIGDFDFLRDVRLAP